MNGLRALLICAVIVIFIFGMMYAAAYLDRDLQSRITVKVDGKEYRGVKNIIINGNDVVILTNDGLIKIERK